MRGGYLRYYIASFIIMGVFLVVFLGLPFYLGITGVATADHDVGECDAHLDDGIKHDEHCALFDTVRYEDVTHKAIKNGNWGDETVWEGDSVPGDDARVLIPIGKTVVFNSRRSARIFSVRVDGVLRFANNKNTELRVDTIVVDVGGKVEIGTASQPIRDTVEAKIIFIDTGSVLSSSRVNGWDPLVLTRGLISHGDIEIYGSRKTAFVSLSGARVGDSQLTLDSAPSNWKVGDRIVLTGVTPPLDWQDEELVITSVSGRKIGIRPSLEYDHTPPESDLKIYVANLDRNVRIESENSEINHRGHVMFMHSDKVKVENAGFYDVGRTDKKRHLSDPPNGVSPLTNVNDNRAGRYAVHFHRTGVDKGNSPAIARGNVVWGSPGWGFVNHNSYVLMEDNIAYEAVGAGFIGEIGNEIGTMKRNIAIKGIGSGESDNKRQGGSPKIGSIDDFGHGGHGFFFQGPGIAVENNIASGMRDVAYMFWLRPLPDRPLEAGEGVGLTSKIANFPLVSLDWEPEVLTDSDFLKEDGKTPSGDLRIKSFRSNAAFASASGLDISRTMILRPKHLETLKNHFHTIDDFTVWNIGDFISEGGKIRERAIIGSAEGVGSNAVFLKYGNNAWIKNSRFIGDFEREHSVGVDRNHGFRNIIIENSVIEGWGTGVRAGFGKFTNVTDSTLDNIVNIEIVGGGHLEGGFGEGNQEVHINNVRFGDFSGKKFDLDLINVVSNPDSNPEFPHTVKKGKLWGIFSKAPIYLEGKRVYRVNQRKDFVVIPDRATLNKLDDENGIFNKDFGINPSLLIGKTNQQLWNKYGLAFLGEIAPENTVGSSIINGGLIVGECESYVGIADLPECVIAECNDAGEVSFNVVGSRCDDGNSCTIDVCGWRGCLHKPDFGEASCQADFSGCKDLDNDGVFDAGSCLYGVDKCIEDVDSLTSSKLSSLRLKSHLFETVVPSGADLRDVLGFEIRKADKSAVKFVSRVSLIDVDGEGCFKAGNLDPLVEISDRKIRVSAEDFMGLNVPADLTFYGVEFSKVKILRDGVGCEDCRIISHNRNSGVLIVRVPGFSTYEVIEGSGNGVGGDAEVSVSSRGGYEDSSVEATGEGLQEEERLYGNEGEGTEDINLESRVSDRSLVVFLLVIGIMILLLILFIILRIKTM